MSDDKSEGGGVVLQLVVDPISPTVIEKLEYLLERARKGEISSVALAWVTSEKRAGITWSECPSKTAMAGAIGALDHAFHDNWD